MEKCLSRRCKSPVHEDNLCKFHFAERDFLVKIGKMKHEMTDEDLKAFSEVSGYSMDEIFKLNQNQVWMKKKKKDQRQQKMYY